MQYLNKNFILLFLYLFSSLPTLANDIVITRKAAPSKALLDRKFIFMQESSSFAKNPQSTVKSSKVHTINQVIPSLVPAKLPSAKNKSLQHSPVNIQDNWDAYAEDVIDELEESLDVEARLLN